MSDVYKQRLELLLKNAFIGLGLVLVLLGVFLEVKLAFWVTMGIPISFLGSFLFLYPAGASVNMISTFAFIIALGIVVDDAIVAGENIYECRQKGMDFLSAAIVGAREVMVPIAFAIISNIVTFPAAVLRAGRDGQNLQRHPAGRHLGLPDLLDRGNFHPADPFGPFPALYRRPRWVYRARPSQSGGSPARVRAKGL